MGYFDHFAADSPTSVGAWLTAKTVKQQFAYLAPYLSQDRSITILEIGPGRGEFASLFLAEGYKNYSVVEPDDQLRAKCEGLPVYKAYSDVIPPLPVDSASQDLILMCDVFEHLNDTATAVAVIRDIRRALKPGGMIFILCPDLLHWKEEFFNCDYSHSNPTTVRRTSQLFQNAQIETFSYSYHYAFLSSWVGFVLGNAIKLATTPLRFLGANNHSRIYRLRLCFLRRFMILGRSI